MLDRYMQLHPCFESALVKIQKNRLMELSEDEKKSVQCLSIYRTEEKPSKCPTKLSFATRAIKKRHISVDSSNSYMDTRFILPTSNICERLFSKAGFALGNRRKSILPSNFELQVFLHMNTISGTSVMSTLS